MRQVEIKLSEWHRLYKELGTVERELADAVLRNAHAESERLRARAVHLIAECDTALKAVNAAIAASKAARGK